MNEFIPPTYRTYEGQLTIGFIHHECDRCGALVLFREKHTTWHSDLQTIMNSLASLTRVLVKELPDDQILTEVDHPPD